MVNGSMTKRRILIGARNMQFLQYGPLKWTPEKYFRQIASPKHCTKENSFFSFEQLEHHLKLTQ